MSLRDCTCWLARRASEFWDFIDKRDIDKHAFAWLVGVCGWGMTKWAMDFADAHPAMSGSDMALVLGAVGAPYALFAGAVVKWYFERKDP